MNKKTNLANKKISPLEKIIFEYAKEANKFKNFYLQEREKSTKESYYRKFVTFKDNLLHNVSLFDDLTIVRQLKNVIEFLKLNKKTLKTKRIRDLKELANNDMKRLEKQYS